jgi:hypothetical protein
MTPFNIISRFTNTLGPVWISNNNTEDEDEHLVGTISMKRLIKLMPNPQIRILACSG